MEQINILILNDFFVSNDQWKVIYNEMLFIPVTGDKYKIIYAFKYTFRYNM